MGVLDYSTTPASNVAINTIDIQGTANVLNFDNAFRQMMADIAAGIAANSFVPASTFQPLDSDLTAIAALTTTTYGRAFLAFSNEAAFKAAVNLEAGVDYQAYDADLTALAGIGVAVSGDVIYASGAGTWARLAKGTSLQVLRMKTDASAPEWGTSRPLLHLQDQKTSGTAGGTFTSGAWQTRTLNTEVTDEIGSTLSTNQFTLPAGTYEIQASCPAYKTGSHKAKLRNVTDTSDVLLGSSEYSDSGNNIQTRATVAGRFTIAAAKTFEIQHQAASTRATDGFGFAASFGTEIYAEVLIWRVA